VWIAVTLALFTASVSAVDSKGQPTKEEIAVEKGEAVASAPVNSKLPKYYPDKFDNQGKITDLNLASNILNVGGTPYNYSPNAKVHTLKTEFGTLQMLKKGMETGFSLNTDSGGQNIITEIWELAPGTVPQE